MQYASRLISGEALFGPVVRGELRRKKIPMPLETLLGARDREPVALETWRSVVFPLCFRRRELDPGIPVCGQILHEADSLVVEEPFIDVTDAETFEERLTELACAARIVHTAHTAGVLHLDLKPDHVRTSRTGRVYVLDWEAAMPFDEQRRSQSFGFAGTPRYMAPEQASGFIDGLTPATDVFGLGMILYEILHGEPARRPRASFAAALRAATGEVIRCCQVVAARAGSLAALCDRSTNLAADLRPGSALEFADLLDEASSFLRGRINASQARAGQRTSTQFGDAN